MDVGWNFLCRIELTRSLVEYAPQDNCANVASFSSTTHRQGISLDYLKHLSSRQLTFFKLTVASKVLRVGLSSGRISAIVDAFECLVTSPFTRQQKIGFYSLGQFYLRFAKTDAQRLGLLVWLQSKTAGFVMLDQPALCALLKVATQQYTDEIARLAVVFQTVRLQRPMERVLMVLDQTMPRLEHLG